MLVDEYAVTRELLETRPEDLAPYTRATLEAGRAIPTYEYSAALRGLERFRWGMRRFFRTYDLLLTPVTAQPAFSVERPVETAAARTREIWAATPYTAAFNLTGQPAASVPCGFTADGLPVALQIAGRSGDDLTVLQVCAAFERAHPWAGRVPPIAEEG